METEEVDPFDSLFEEPAHWQRAGELVAAINDLSALHPECDISAENLTEQAIDKYPDMIKRARRLGRLDDVSRLEQSMQDVSIRSATGTSVSVLILANTYEAYDLVRPVVFALIQEHCAVRDTGDELYDDSEAPTRSNGLPYDQELPHVGARLFFSCR